MTKDHGLSREQVEALAIAAYPLSSPGIWAWDELSDDYRRGVRQQVHRTIAPTVAAMLADAEKRGEDRGRAEGAMAVAREAWKYGVHRRALSGPPVLSVTVRQMPVIADAALARHTATAAQEGSND